MRSRITLCFVAASLAVAATAQAKTWVVNEGESIQAAVDQAEPGDTVKVKRGTYQEAGSPCPMAPAATCAVSVTTPDLKIVGSHGAVLENPGGQAFGIAIAPEGVVPATCLDDEASRLAGATVRGLSVNGFDAMGIFLLCVDRFDVSKNATHDNVEYGIFPSHSTRGRIALNVATGSNDTGIYIGQSFDVRVHHNLARGNVSGFEIENSTGVRTDHNLATGNTGGILSFALPGLDVTENSDNRIDHNVVTANNKPNTCTDPDDAVCAVPQGSGILVLAADANRVDHNLVLGNDSYGIAVANFCVANGLTPEQCAALDIEPNSDDTRIDHNLAKNNGGNPSPLLDPVFAVDLAWDTTGTGNCWEKNKNETQFPEELPACE